MDSIPTDGRFLETEAQPRTATPKGEQCGGEGRTKDGRNRPNRTVCRRLNSSKLLRQGTRHGQRNIQRPRVQAARRRHRSIRWQLLVSFTLTTLPTLARR